MEYKFGLYGDSIAFGYGNNGQSWFDSLFGECLALKMAQNGERTADVAQKLKRDRNHYHILFLAVGLNDLLIPWNSGEVVCFSELTAKYEGVLKLATEKADRVVVQAVLPVREELFPSQVWLEQPMQVFNKDVSFFNQRLLYLSRQNGAVYLDAAAEFENADLSRFYLDAMHLNSAGLKKLCDFYRKCKMDI